MIVQTGTNSVEVVPRATPVDMEELHSKITQIRTQTLDIHAYLTDPQVSASAASFGAFDLHEEIIKRGSAVVSIVEKVHQWSKGAQTLESDISDTERAGLFRLLSELSQIQFSYYKSFQRIRDFDAIMPSIPKGTVVRLFQESRLCIFETWQLLT